ncbi:MAG TPA: hypothetical protein VG322_01665 [Candidatus Acidoferrales bacterium]|nr:hypothetical protein [Candidatus Acidoferrales bacterium]
MADLITADASKVLALFKEFHDWYRQYLADIGLLSEKAIQFNSHVMSFYERMMLVSIGTIGLSVTALTSIVSKTTLSPYSRHIFVSLIAPAWILLLLSAILARITMAHLIVANKSVYDDWHNAVNSHNLNLISVTLTRLSGALSGKVEIEQTEKDVSVLFRDSAQELRKLISDQQKAHNDKKKPNVMIPARMGQIAGLSMTLGLVFLGISAIRLFLGL